MSRDSKTGRFIEGKNAALIIRFEQKYITEPNTGCWLWTAAAGIYGRIGLGSREDGWEHAHRVSWMLYRGPIPEGMHILHRCDIPLCVNPNHLFLGTHGDNMRDAVRKGRANSEAARTKSVRDPKTGRFIQQEDFRENAGPLIRHPKET